jgi:hypothetical protein
MTAAELSQLMAPYGCVQYAEVSTQQISVALELEGMHLQARVRLRQAPCLGCTLARFSQSVGHRAGIEQQWHLA